MTNLLYAGLRAAFFAAAVMHMPVVTASSSAATCPDDCSLNGVCTANGVCKCDAYVHSVSEQFYSAAPCKHNVLISIYVSLCYFYW